MKDVSNFLTRLKPGQFKQLKNLTISETDLSDSMNKLQEIFNQNKSFTDLFPTFPVLERIILNSNGLTADSIYLMWQVITVFFPNVTHVSILNQAGLFYAWKLLSSVNSFRLKNFSTKDNIFRRSLPCFISALIWSTTLKLEIPKNSTIYLNDDIHSLSIYKYSFETSFICFQVWKM